MLALLSETARELGVTTIQTQSVDSRDPEVEPDCFDAAVSRNALMLMADRDIARLAPARCRPGVDPHRLCR